MRIWIEARCQSCLAINFIDDGEWCDVTVPDCEGFVCWECRTNNEVDDEGNVTLSQEDQVSIGERIPHTAEQEYK